MKGMEIPPGGTSFNAYRTQRKRERVGKYQRSIYVSGNFYTNTIRSSRSTDKQRLVAKVEKEISMFLIHQR